MLVLFALSGGFLIVAILIFYFNVKPRQRGQKKKSDLSLLDHDWGKFKNKGN